MGDGVQGEPDLSGKMVQGDLEAEEWRELSLDSVMADFDAAVDTDSAEPEAMATVKVVDSDDAPRDVSSFTSQLATSNPDFTLSGLKSHLVQNLVKKPNVPAGPLPLLAPLPSPLLSPCRTFLASLILASKFTQDRCYSNKAWAKLSGLPPREIGRCEHALGDVLEWRLWVGKTPTGCPPPSSNHSVVRSKSDEELIAKWPMRSKE
jgi:PHO85 cyclin-5